MSSAPPRLKVEGLCKSFFGVGVLHDVSFEAQAGEVLGIVGENGSGKSILLEAMAIITASAARAGTATSVRRLQTVFVRLSRS